MADATAINGSSEVPCLYFSPTTLYSLSRSVRGDLVHRVRQRVRDACGHRHVHPRLAPPRLLQQLRQLRRLLPQRRKVQGISEKGVAAAAAVVIVASESYRDRLKGGP